MHERQPLDHHYEGRWFSVETYVAVQLSRFYVEQIPDWIKPYVRIDVAAYARDMVDQGIMRVEDVPEGGVDIYLGI